MCGDDDEYWQRIGPGAVGGGGGGAVCAQRSIDGDRHDRSDSVSAALGYGSSAEAGKMYRYHSRKCCCSTSTLLPW